MRSILINYIRIFFVRFKNIINRYPTIKRVIMFLLYPFPDFVMRVKYLQFINYKTKIKKYRDSNFMPAFNPKGQRVYEILIRKHGE